MFKCLLNKKTKQLALKRKSDRMFRSFDALQSFLVLFEASNHEDVIRIIASLEKIGKQVSAYGYVARNDVTDYSSVPCRMLLPKTDYKRSGCPSNELIKEIKSISCDIVLDLTLKENPTLNYLLAVSNAPLRTGLNKNDAFPYDLSISINDGLADEQALSVKYLSEQIIYYLKTISSPLPD
jgi:hypothetical protein